MRMVPLHLRASLIFSGPYGIRVSRLVEVIHYVRSR